MDSQTTAVVTYSGFLISIASVIIGVINHKRIRSNCCGREITSSIDIENTSPRIIDVSGKRHIPAQMDSNI
jgi:hypothetical protein